MCGYRDVDYTTTLMSQDNQHEQQPIRHGAYDEEVGGHNLVDVISEECSPGLRWRTSVARHVSRDRGLADIDAELQKFAVDSWRASERVGFRHAANQSADIRRNGRPTAPPAFPDPEEPEALTVPGEDRLRLDDSDGCAPVIPDLREPDPQHGRHP